MTLIITTPLVVYMPMFLYVFIDVTLQVCGSVRSGFALKESDTNIRIVAPKTANLAIVMKGIYDTLLKSGMC